MHRITLLLTAALLSVSQIGFAEQVYSLEPTDLDGWLMTYPVGDWQLAGGTITTDGTMGELQEHNIVDFEIKVIGPEHSHTFNYGQHDRLSVNGLLATSTSLQFASEEMAGSKSRAFQVFEANPTQKCSDCERYVSWGAYGDRPTGFTYEIYDQVSYSVPDASISGRVDLIAAAVPEPAAAPMAIVAVFATFGATRRRRS